MKLAVRPVFILAALALMACEAKDVPPSQHCGIQRDHAWHACLHGKSGPFETIDGRLSQPAPLVSNLHVLYTVSLEKRGAYGHAGHLRFAPAHPGLWGFFVSPLVLLEAETPDGRRRPWDVSTPETNCAHFGGAYVMHLAADESIVLTVRNVPTPMFRFLPERLGDSWTRALETEHCTVLTDGGASFVDAGATLDTTHHSTGDAASHDTRTPNDGGVNNPATDAALPQPPPPPTMDAGNHPMCRFEGPCTGDDECCAFCHDQDHCH